MSMYASQKISRDPWPYVALHADGSEQLRRYRTAEAAERNAREWKHSPRPEFDNDPNPVLQNFRGYVKATGNTASGAARAWADGHLDLILKFSIPCGFSTEDHARHARRVLQRLADLEAPKREREGSEESAMHDEAEQIAEWKEATR